MATRVVLRSKFHMLLEEERAMPANWWVFYVPGGDGYWQDPNYVRRIANTKKPKKNWWWTCHEETVEGDRALLYAKAPISAIVGIIEAASNAKEKHHEFSSYPWVCDYFCVTVFDEPIYFRYLLRDEELRKQWGLIRGNFQPPGGKAPRVTGSTLKLLASRYPQLEPYI